MRIRVSIYIVVLALLGILEWVLLKRGELEWIKRILFAEFVTVFVLATYAIYFVAKSKRLTNQIRAIRGKR